MRAKSLLIIFLGALLVAFAPAQPKVRIFIAGDSTAKTYDVTANLMRGWGQMLSEFFNENVEVINHAEGARSSGTFIKEGRWDKLLAQVQPGDYVLVQFGHNDTSPNMQRYVSPEDYTANFLRFCADVKAKNANPILLTSIAMREFDENGKVVVKRNHFAEYIELVRQAAKTADVPMIDMHVKGMEMLQKFGVEDSKKLYYWIEAGKGLTPQEAKQDDTHLQEAGARQYASFVAEGVKKLKIKPLRKYLK